MAAKIPRPGPVVAAPHPRARVTAGVPGSAQASAPDSATAWAAAQPCAPLRRRARDRACCRLDTSDPTRRGGGGAWAGPWPRTQPGRPPKKCDARGRPHAGALRSPPPLGVDRTPGNARPAPHRNPDSGQASLRGAPRARPSRDQRAGSPHRSPGRGHFLGPWAGRSRRRSARRPEPERGGREPKGFRGWRLAGALGPPKPRRTLPVRGSPIPGSGPGGATALSWGADPPRLGARLLGCAGHHLPLSGLQSHHVGLRRLSRSTGGLF